MAKITRLFRFEQASGLLMIAAMLLALGAANSPLAPIYATIHHTPIHVRFGSLIIDEPLVRWINEGLMVIFFLLVGLEIKRQFREGHLASLPRAALPGFAAIGGMIVPALIYGLLNWSDTSAIRGWAIPTATDIVLALGVLSLLGSRVPSGLKVFLAALAIFDDVGAVLIISLFYGETPALTPLLVAGSAVVGLFVLNYFSIVRPVTYLLVGLVLWVAMLKAGMTSALAGVVIALAVPMRAPCRDCPSPLRETERRLHPWGVLFVVPVFAFFNAGITIDTDTVKSSLGTVSFGIAGGLFLGKQLGVFGTARMVVALGLAQLPRGVTWAQLYGVALIAGIGFTMSLYLASLAFANLAMADPAKFAILFGSLLSAVSGLVVLRLAIGKGLCHMPKCGPRNPP